LDHLDDHPLANLFPLIEGDDFAALTADIKTRGLHDIIDIYQGKILDGRNRYRALVAAGIDIEKRHFRAFHPEFYGDPLDYVIAKNLKRRHLNESQRAMVADKLATMRQGERVDLAIARQSADRSDPIVCDVGDASRKLETVGYVKPHPRPANLPVIDQASAAKALSISERALRHARATRRTGTPELIRAVERGKLAVSSAAQAARLAPDIQRRIAEESEAGAANVVRTVIKQEARAMRETELGAKQAALPQKKYGVILADPEWKFKPWSQETGMDRAADNHYPTSELCDIAARDVVEIAADDSVLYLWGTIPMLPQAFAVMRAWGFDYKSAHIWGKDKIGLGYWARENCEVLLIGTRGKPPAPAPGTQRNHLIIADRGEHSAKPEYFLEMIERHFPTLPKIELNRRGPARPGWDAWGNEAITESIQAIDAAPPMGDVTPAPSSGEAGAGTSPIDEFAIPDFLRRRA